MSRLTQLEAFVATVEAGSFTAAAKRAGLAKSAMSRRVSELEARLGVQLLNRTTRTLSLTDEGVSLLARARTLLADWEEMEADARRASAMLSGPVRLSVPLSYGLNRLAPALTAFMAAHPDVALDIDMSDRKVDLVGEGFDLAVRIGELPDSDLRVRALETVGFIAVASPAFVAAHGAPDTPTDLAALPELRFSLRPRTGWDLIAPNGKTVTLEGRAAHRATNGDFTLAAARAGLGWCVEPDFIIGDAVEHGELIRLLPGYRFPDTQAQVVYPATRHISARVRALVDHLAAWCQSEGTH